jgi:hypothetical protein
MDFDKIKKIYDEQQTRITRLKFLVFQVILVTVDIGTDFYAAVEHYKYVLNFNNVHNKPSLTEHISHNVWIYTHICWEKTYHILAWDGMECRLRANSNVPPTQTVKPRITKLFPGFEISKLTNLSLPYLPASS